MGKYQRRSAVVHTRDARSRILVFTFNEMIEMSFRGEIRHCRHCQQQCKIFASGVNFSILTYFFVLLSPKLLEFGEIKGLHFLAWKSGSVKFLTNLMSDVISDFRKSVMSFEKVCDVI